MHLWYLQFFSNNALEDPDNVAYTFGGRLASDGGEAGTRVYSSSKWCSAPAFPVWRQKMAAAYGSGQGSMACGGLDSKGLATDGCWIFTEGQSQWEETKATDLKLAGSSAVWYKGEFWLLGGSSSDENAKSQNNVNKKVTKCVYFLKLSMSSRASNTTPVLQNGLKLMLVSSSLSTQLVLSTLRILRKERLCF